MLDVYITVDTEVWWSAEDLSQFADDFDRWFYGRTVGGDFGVAYQVDRLSQYRLTAAFFVEPLFSLAVGIEPLVEMVDVIHSAGQDVQLHIHTEWLDRMRDAPITARGEHMRSFTLGDQEQLLRVALARLREAGAESVCAFRAGNYGANNDTLSALARVGIQIDTSYNYTYLGAACDMRRDGMLLQPDTWNGVVEVPITFFEDRPGHYRHAQLTAVSFQELRAALISAYRAGWTSFVIVSHSFELLNSARTAPDPVVIKRFDRLCRFLAEHGDKFRTRGFEPGYVLPPIAIKRPLRGSVTRTALRIAEQIVRRARYG